MSTNSIIGLRKLNGDIRYIFCHWDGYPEYNGVILKYFYTDLDKMKRLLKLGNLSGLGQVFKETENERGCVSCHELLGKVESYNMSKLLKNIDNLQEDYKRLKYDFDYLYILDEKSLNFETYKLTDVYYPKIRGRNCRFGTLTPLKPDYRELLKKAVKEGIITLHPKKH